MSLDRFRRKNRLSAQQSRATPMVGGENASLWNSCGMLRKTREKFGGERGIRTLGRVSPTHAFQACSFNHSDISPYVYNQSFTGEWMSPETRIVSDLLM